MGRKKYVLPTGMSSMKLLTRSQVVNIIQEMTKTKNVLWNGTNGDGVCTRAMTVLMLMRI